MTIRGVLLARRDNCSWTREFYEKIVRSIMESKTDNFKTIENYIVRGILQLLQWHPSTSDMNQFIITKALNDDYKVKALQNDKDKVQKRFKDLNLDLPKTFDIEKMNRDIEKGKSVTSYIQEYINRSKPSHVQLSHRMEERGLPISVGTRMEFVVLEHYTDPNGKLGQK